MMNPGMMACANCHGPDGKGGTLQMMMTTFQVPDIRYSTLTQSEQSSFTDETIKRAITQGIDQEGKSLDWPMSRWQMDDTQSFSVITLTPTAVSYLEDKLTFEDIPAFSLMVMLMPG